MQLCIHRDTCNVAHITEQTVIKGLMVGVHHTGYVHGMNGHGGVRLSLLFAFFVKRACRAGDYSAIWRVLAYAMQRAGLTYASHPIRAGDNMNSHIEC